MVYEIEVALIYGASLSLMATAGAVAYYASIANQERIRQAGIDSRAGNAHTGAPYRPGEWYVPILTELAKNPQAVEMATKLLPQLMEMLKKRE